MKKAVGVILVSLLMVMQVLTIHAKEPENFPDEISYLTIKAFNVEDENQTLANVLVEIYDEAGESLGVFETNQEGDLLIEVIPGLYRIEIVESVAGFEPVNESKVQVVDATDVDLYRVNLLHTPLPLESVSARVIPQTGLEELLMPLALGGTLMAGGFYLTKRKR